MDVGSGGGSPAIPFKLASPRLKLTMVEAKARKSAFLREAIRHLGSGETRRSKPPGMRSFSPGPSCTKRIDVVSIRAVRTRRAC